MPTPPFGGLPGRRDLTTHKDGYTGVYTTAEAWGAWRNGTRVAKDGAVDYDEVPNGTIGTVIGSITTHDRFFYFVVWDNRPYTVAGLAGLRLLGPVDQPDAPPDPTLVPQVRRQIR